MCARSVLLIESEASIREVLCLCLRRAGDWQVILSSSVQEGATLCQEAHPDLILLSTSTPETDALLFNEQLKQCSTKKSIPILVITARASQFTAQQIREMGFAGAIAKPFDLATLPAQITHLLQSEQSNQSNHSQEVSETNLAIALPEENLTSFQIKNYGINDID